MNESIQLLSMTGRPRVTVAAIAERDERFLLVEEMSPSGDPVINQPAGHVEEAETIVAAVIRETLEETAYEFEPSHLVGIYLWRSPATEQSFLRICIAGTVGTHHEGRDLDDGILRPLWLTRGELSLQASRLRSPLVVHCIDDYLSGERYSLSILKSLLPD